MAWDKTSPAAAETPAVSQPVILANFVALEAALGSGTLAATNTIAQGDVLTGTAANTLTNLATGTAGQVLMSGGAAADLSWASKGAMVQLVNVQENTKTQDGTAFPSDDTIPQNAEGLEVMTLAITPKSATNKLKIEYVVHASSDSGVSLGTGLFQDTTAGALACAYNDTANGQITQINFTHYMTAGTTSETTFKVRCGSSSGNTTINGEQNGRKGGGVLYSSITITEIYV